jgi:hypothetical protein
VKGLSEQLRAYYKERNRDQYFNRDLKDLLVDPVLSDYSTLEKQAEAWGRRLVGMMVLRRAVNTFGLVRSSISPSVSLPFLFVSHLEIVLAIFSGQHHAERHHQRCGARQAPCSLVENRA